MSSTNSDKMPRSLGATAIFLCFAHGLCTVWAYLAYLCAVSGAWFVAGVFVSCSVFAFRGPTATAGRDAWVYAWRQRHAIQLTKQMKRFFTTLEIDKPYWGMDVTRGHQLRVLRLDKSTTLVADPTGCYLFYYAIAAWSPTPEEINMFDPKPATYEQLKAIGHRLRTYV